jgi:very-short-patch-repair endonuclease
VRAGAPGTDAVIARIAAAQRGVVTRAQLLDAGVSRRAIERRLAKELLHRLHQSVYLVGHPVPAPLALETAALLVCGEGSVLSHRSAAALWGFAAAGPKVHVTVTKRRRDHLNGVRVNHTRTLPMTDLARRDGLPVTAPARTLLDYAETVGADELERALAQARVMRLLADGELEAQIARAAGRRGTRPLRILLQLEGGPAFTRSTAERKFLALLRRAAIPPPRCNAVVHGHEVDFLWTEQGLIVEIDGFAYHRTREAFEKDRRRDVTLQLAGYRVLRITWRTLHHEPEAVVAQIATALAGGQRSAASKPAWAPS